MSFLEKKRLNGKTEGFRDSASGRVDHTNSCSGFKLTVMIHSVKSVGSLQLHQAINVHQPPIRMIKRVLVQQ